ncbi:hypothetical protein Y1Q_0002383 [Alligator mississippiensis]|uniref:Uncharacterized protein n=1 Tax=Alligator mississippiensis TaxID=8496 RepID=A0A151MGX8_ALLMI|nr:hypothetical protein Y1Q_0002383 [Alligator mississippiensis]
MQKQRRRDGVMIKSLVSNLEVMGSICVPDCPRLPWNRMEGHMLRGKYRLQPLVMSLQNCQLTHELLGYSSMWTQLMEEIEYFISPGLSDSHSVTM